VVVYLQKGLSFKFLQRQTKTYYTALNFKLKKFFNQSGFKCPNCGAITDGKECEYCKANVSIQSASNVINQSFADSQIALQKIQDEKAAKMEKNRLARLAIHNRKCPVCETPFKRFLGQQASISCKNCGASILEYTYTDKM